MIQLQLWTPTFYLTAWLKDGLNSSFTWFHSSFTCTEWSTCWWLTVKHRNQLQLCKTLRLHLQKFYIGNGERKEKDMRSEETKTAYITCINKKRTFRSLLLKLVGAVGTLLRYLITLFDCYYYFYYSYCYNVVFYELIRLNELSNQLRYFLWYFFFIPEPVVSSVVQYVRTQNSWIRLHAIYVYDSLVHHQITRMNFEKYYALLTCLLLLW